MPALAIADDQSLCFRPHPNYQLCNQYWYLEKRCRLNKNDFANIAACSRPSALLHAHVSEHKPRHFYSRLPDLGFVELTLHILRKLTCRDLCFGLRIQVADQQSLPWLDYSGDCS